jgi:GMP synthase (glutamine-hydrolysing)
VRPLIVVKTGTTLPGLRERRGDYEDWIVAGLGIPWEQVQVVAVHEGAALPDPEQVAGAVVTGSPAMVSEREPWSERAAGWLCGAAEAGMPLLGICYGHQLLAQGLGGRVGPNPQGREIGTVRVALRRAGQVDPLLGCLPPVLRVQATHVEAVLELPPGARLLGSSPVDPNHVFAWGPRAWGVQFHPEFDADVMRAYLEARREMIRSEGIDPAPLERGVAESSHGTRLLRRFAGLLRR